MSKYWFNWSTQNNELEQNKHLFFNHYKMVLTFVHRTPTGSLKGEKQKYELSLEMIFELAYLHPKSYLKHSCITIVTYRSRRVWWVMMRIIFSFSD